MRVRIGACSTAYFNLTRFIRNIKMRDAPDALPHTNPRNTILHHHEKHKISSTHDATAVLPQLVISGITSHSYSHVFTRLVQNNPLLRCHSRVAAIAYILPRQCEILMQWLHTNTSNYKHSNALPQPWCQKISSLHFLYIFSLSWTSTASTWPQSEAEG